MHAIRQDEWSFFVSCVQSKLVEEVERPVTMPTTKTKIDARQHGKNVWKISSMEMFMSQAADVCYCAVRRRGVSLDWEWNVQDVKKESKQKDKKSKENQKFQETREGVVQNDRQVENDLFVDLQYVNEVGRTMYACKQVRSRLRYYTGKQLYRSVRNRKRSPKLWRLCTRKVKTDRRSTIFHTWCGWETGVNNMQTDAQTD
ncbi:uncharacterized protein FOMMEDRAFT_32393 [Fomitiporia mediterranea MF3/22]|uniref:Uncharacterized protein n=1 Tax=Fomitiporia mediterranea (strain MF3/22) TaxID=694068 RepID=R7SJ14_FOMME|nr:uncharacterized protein FOMMEDRAFT_32393 [Fomitiporia mediterranea MF3/22]EJC97609.1 hypothetical protein FOMMEDRAFT_32393 [Fomitiporia mediterranea MF3/22]